LTIEFPEVFFQFDLIIFTGGAVYIKRTKALAAEANQIRYRMTGKISTVSTTQRIALSNPFYSSKLPLSTPMDSGR
jgi:hypothetical protein